MLKLGALITLAAVASAQSTQYTYVGVAEPGTWADARAACRARGSGADLAVIPDQRHNLAVLAAMRQANLMIAWLGIQDAPNSDNHIWVNGDEPTYARWIGGGSRPNPSHDQDCAVMYDDELTPGRWDEHTCDSNLVGFSTLVSRGQYCSNSRPQGSHPHGFGFTQVTCATSSAVSDGCGGSHFYWAPSYNGQCKCATDDCSQRSNSGGHNIYAILQNPGYVCGTPVPTSNPMTSTPTQQPSMAPTQWFEHPGHEATVTMLQSAVAELEVTVRNLQAQLAASASLPGEVESLVARVTEMAENITAVQEQNADFASLQNALLSAIVPNEDVVAADCSDSGCAPMITATGLDVEIRAVGGKVRLTTDECGAVDLCEAGAFAVNLREALQSV